MKLSFIVPPCFGPQASGRAFGRITRVVYPAPNIYELWVAAYLESDIPRHGELPRLRIPRQEPRRLRGIRSKRPIGCLSITDSEPLDKQLTRGYLHNRERASARCP